MSAIAAARANTQEVTFEACLAKATGFELTELCQSIIRDRFVRRREFKDHFGIDQALISRLGDKNLSLPDRAQIWETLSSVANSQSIDQALINRGVLDLGNTYRHSITSGPLGKDCAFNFGKNVDPIGLNSKNKNGALL
jgi:hypothetical protein